MCDDCSVYLGGGKCSDKCKAIKALEALEKEPSREMKEIEEVINCDADAETKCKMISNILTAKPHYFDDSQGSEDNVMEEIDFIPPKKIVGKLISMDVLDKIKAEIEQTADEERKHDEKWATGLRYAVKIIDKYRKEE